MKALSGTELLPTGTVTFLFTDIEGSTRLLEELGAPEYSRRVEGHRSLLRECAEQCGGAELGTEGDALFFAFHRATDALHAAGAAQRALRELSLGVRMGVHTGEPLISSGEYFGIDLHKAARIAAAGHGGQILLSEQAATFARPEELLDLGQHRLKDLARAERIYQLSLPGLPHSFPPLRSLDSHLHNLPLQDSPLIGRAREIEQIAQRLATASARMLTLTGPAGTGKTRLSLAAAAESVEFFPDGVYFVDLAPLRDHHLVLPTLAQSMGIRDESGHPPLLLLRDHLREKRMLVVLDNLEHLLPCAPEIGDLLHHAPGLKILATSRTPLHIRGEYEFPVEPLPLPEPGPGMAMDEIVRFESVQMFLDRARAVRPDFLITPENAIHVVEICRRLDGLPLAIELAAARIRVLTPEAMLARLSGRLKLLTAGLRDVPARQQTLRGALDWSHDLLQPEEQLLFRRLATFAGGATLEATEAVCLGEEEQQDALEGISSLVEKSLLRQVERSGEPRVLMLETVQEYARERLAQSGEQDEIGRRHADYFLGIVEGAAPSLDGPQQSSWLRRLEADHDNIRAALRWSLDRGEVDRAIRMGAALSAFWMAHGHLREGSRWLEQILTAPTDEAPPRLRAKALVAAAALSRQQGDPVRAEQLVREALDLSRSIGDERALATALINLGALLGERGDIASAEPVFEEALGLLTSSNDPRLHAMVLTNLGVTAELRGDPERATTLYEESLVLYRRLGDSAGASLAVSNLGQIALGTGDHAAAGLRFRESIRIAWTSGHTYGPVHELANLALVASSSGQHERALLLFAAFEGRLQALGAARTDTHRDRYDAALAAAREVLGRGEASRVWEAGLALSLDQAIELALGPVEGGSGGP